MMKNKRAGDCLKYIKMLSDAGIKMNAQLVLCRGINDGDELRNSLEKLSEYAPQIMSIAAVPVGLTKYRDGLCDLKGYDKESAKEVIEIINEFGDNFMKQHGTRLCYPADEFFLKAGYEMPGAEYYEEFSQIENGVGMWASFKSQVIEAIADFSEDNTERTVSIATSVSAYKLFEEIVDLLKEKWHNLHIELYCIKNDFFGHTVTVAGLITGEDFKNQLKDLDLGDELLIPRVSLRNEGDKFLDDVTIEELSEFLNIKVTAVESDGAVLLDKLINGGA
jgi:putative radical SAM enzyme (TIGR03279 family)